MSEAQEIADALRRIARGIDALADAVAPRQPEGPRILELLRAWGDRGLTREETSALFRAHGFAPQTAGGWARGEWIEIQTDGLRYATPKSRAWLAEQEDDDDG